MAEITVRGPEIPHFVFDAMRAAKKEPGNDDAWDALTKAICEAILAGWRESRERERDEIVASFRALADRAKALMQGGPPDGR